ncbi:hypothetical protein PRZ48_008761 [Zasmidium cellare]|uniref:Aminoglycoside phosphotransferase domain-containing protein n=1 Tax=Zasmidium cellare TaxID=395010 RepID=A0ABR0EGE2_ZASCE|nr:hypothetical protein PRZ48_008761 [Zasmidium cellare]
MYWRDGWPTLADGSVYDGKRLLELVRNGERPFSAAWDVNLLIREIEQELNTQVADIPLGFQLELSNRPSAVARLARGDVNWPNFDGFSVDFQISEIKFEAEVYKLMETQPAIKASKLLYHRAPKQHEGPRTTTPQDIQGRRLMVFERAQGGSGGVWRRLSSAHQLDVVAQAAVIRAALFHFQLPPGFAEKWLRERLFEQKPKSFDFPVASTREFCVALFTSKIEATIRNIGDIIGWEDDGNVVGPKAAAAKKSLLRLIPYMLPQEEGSNSEIYRLVLEHGDFGIHNMTIDDEGSSPEITSVFDWETGCIVPALLSDTLMCTLVDLGIDGQGRPAVTRVDRNSDQEVAHQQKALTERYHKVLFEQAPDYQKAVQAGIYARHLWFALRDWRGDDPEEYFRRLGAWADETMRKRNAVVRSEEDK